MACNCEVFYRTPFPLEGRILCFDQSTDNYTVISSFTDTLIETSDVFRYVHNERTFWKTNAQGM